MSSPFISVLAIDPLFLFFPENIALILSQIHHPDGPAIADIQKALQSVSPEVRIAIAKRAQFLGALGRRTEEAIREVAAKAERAG